MNILYCLNPQCPHPENPTHYNYCQGCGGDLRQNTLSYAFHTRYLIVGVLGEGAFGRTYKAEDLNFNGKPRVIKKFIAQVQGAALQKSQELFQREAEKLDELKHEQIPTVYDYFSEGNSLYLVQEFIEGETLLEEYQREGRFSEQKVREILRELLPVLVYLHSKGLVHRDIKPDNLMRRRSDGKLMLIDFGGIKEQTSQMGTGLYTPGYAAYEHIMGRAIAASDLYSLAATCVRLLTGYLPPGDSNLVDPVYDVDERRWSWQPVLKSQNRSISVFLAGILDKMLADKSSDRYQTASEVLTALNNPNQRTTVVQPPPDRSSGGKIKTQSGMTRRNWLKYGVGMVLGVSAFGILGIVLRNKDKITSVVTPSPSPSEKPITPSPSPSPSETLKSAKGVDYSKLQQLLAQGDWKQADQETRDRMLEAMGKNIWVDVYSSDIANFPCEDLSTMDQLWVKHSEGRFGFSVQKDIWLEVGGEVSYDTERKLGDRVGWRKGGEWMSYDSLQFNLSAPPGHLPGLLPVVVDACGVKGGGGLVLIVGCGSSLAQRVVTCKI